MKKILFLLLCTLATVAEAQAVGVLQNVYGRKTTSLNGWWQVIIDPYDAGFYDYRMQKRGGGMGGLSAMLMGVVCLALGGAFLWLYRRGMP